MDAENQEEPDGIRQTGGKTLRLPREIDTLMGGPGPGRRDDGQSEQKPMKLRTDRRSRSRRVRWFRHQNDLRSELFIRLLERVHCARVHTSVRPINEMPIKPRTLILSGPSSSRKQE